MTRPGPNVLPDESLDGIVASAAAAVAETSIRKFTGIFETGVGNRRGIGFASPERLATVAEIVDADLDDLVNRSWHPVHEAEAGPSSNGSCTLDFFGMPISTYLIEKRRRLFSRTALRAAAYHRASWALRPFPFCAESMELLEDTCPGCGTVQGWRNTNGVENCDACAGPLDRGVGGKVPSRLHDVLRTAAALGSTDRKTRHVALEPLPAAVREAGAGTAIELLCAIAVSIDPTIRQPQRRSLPSPSADAGAVARAVAEAWPFLSSWPSGLLDAIDAEGSAWCDRGNARLASAGAQLLRASKLGHMSAGTAALVAEFGEACRERCDGQIDLPSVCRATGLSTHQVVRARREGRLGGHVDIEARPPRFLYQPDAAAALGVTARTSTTFERTARALGVTYRCVEELVEMGVLEDGAVVPGRREATRRRITNASLSRLHGDLAALAGRIRPGDRTLADAMSVMGGRLKPWAPAFATLLRGEEPFGLLPGTIPLSERIRLDRDGAIRIAGLPDAFPPNDARFSPKMTKKEAASILNVKDGAAAALFPHCRGTMGRSVPIPEVLELARKYAAAREIAAAIGRTGRAISKLAQTAGVEKASAAGYLRVDLARILGAWHRPRRVRNAIGPRRPPGRPKGSQSQTPN